MQAKAVIIRGLEILKRVKIFVLCTGKNLFTVKETCTVQGKKLVLVVNFGGGEKDGKQINAD